MRRLRITHVITGLDTGGAEMALRRLVGLMGADFEQTVIALGPEGTLSAEVEASATLRHLGMERGRVTLGDILRLRREISVSRPDVIQGWMYHANLLSTVAGLGLRIPVVWSIHHSLTDYRRNKLGLRAVIRICEMMSRLPQQIVYCSRLSRQQHVALGYSDRRGRFIPNGTDVVQFHPDVRAREELRRELEIPSNALMIGLVARWHPMKDHSTFLRAAALLVQRRSSVVFVLVGDGLSTENAELMHLVNSLGLQGRVRLCGRRRDVPAINAALDIASSSSWSEAFPLVLGEAMACGTPCVATDVGDSRDIIADTGLVVPPRDPDALAAGWDKLALLGDGGRQALGARARQRVVEKYSLERNAEAYGAIYRSVARRQG